MLDDPRVCGDDTRFPATSATLSRHQYQSVQVNRIPASMANRADRPSLLVPGGLNHDRLARADAIDEEIPDSVSDAAAWAADKHASGHLNHPSREMPP